MEAECFHSILTDSAVSSSDPPLGAVCRYHRQAVVGRLGDATGEVAFVNEVLQQDAKNYHAHSYRYTHAQTHHTTGGGMLDPPTHTGTHTKTHMPIDCLARCRLDIVG